MREPAAHLTIQSIVDQARRATGATTAWLLAASPAGLMVAAGSGPVAAPPGTILAPGGPRAYAMSSGQAVALVPQPGDPDSIGLGGSAGAPVSVLLVPVVGAPDGPAGAVGLLEAAGKEGARPFTLDDISRVGLLAPVAAAALAELEGGPAPTAAAARPPSPAAVAAALEHLAGSDPTAYDALVVMLRAVLGPR
ncbi:MAG: GAF domain-containing protein [Acidimicrobiales bacterium]